MKMAHETQTVVMLMSSGIAKEKAALTLGDVTVIVSFDVTLPSVLP